VTPKNKRFQPIQLLLPFWPLGVDGAASPAGSVPASPAKWSIYDLRTEAGLSQAALAKRMATTQSVISRLEEGGGARNRIDTLARVAIALNRHLVVSFPEQIPGDLANSVLVA
jgi:DNA-binding XRE family transcriptional regulator